MSRTAILLALWAILLGVIIIIVPPPPPTGCPQCVYSFAPLHINYVYVGIASTIIGVAALGVTVFRGSKLATTGRAQA